MALILPKGIVVNSAEIEGSIESVDTDPLDLADIAKFWKVYTTTKRRLLDPTAERLENYWWRIWGSRRRELNGATVAKLFAYISDGHSFVPLRGPANRDEGTPPLDRTAFHGPGAVSTTMLHRSSHSRPSTTSSSSTSKGPVAMPHPILKKTRGPSATGPRPTARFISPHESEDEVDPDSPVSPNSHVVVQPPSPESMSSKTDTKPGSRKKSQSFVVSTAAKKKRPVVARRQGSQSSNESAANIDAMLHSSSEKTPPAFSEHPRGKRNAAKGQENFSPDYLVAQSPRKQLSSRSADAKRGTPRKSPRKERFALGADPKPDVAALGDPGPSSRRRSIEVQQTPANDHTQEGVEELDEQRMLLEEGHAHLEKTGGGTVQKSSKQTQNETVQVLHKSLRSRSDGTQAAPQDMGAIRYLPHDAKGTATQEPTFADATGLLDSGDTVGNLAPKASEPSRVAKGKTRDIEESKRNEMFAKRPVPSISTTSASAVSDGSLARSKSQLTFLLEKDRARSSEHNSRE